MGRKASNVIKSKSTKSAMGKHPDKFVKWNKDKFSSACDLIDRYKQFDEIYKRIRKGILDKNLLRKLKDMLKKERMEVKKEVKEGSARSLSSWMDQDAICESLANEMYRMAKRCFETGDVKHGQRFIDLMVKFLRLSYIARKERMIEEAQKLLHELKEIYGKISSNNL